jgi:hypothetical protein
VNQRLEMGGSKSTERPVFSATDRGKWKLVSYVSNGSGPIVLKHDDLQFFGLLSGTISNDEELKTFFGAKHLVRLNQSWSEGLVWFLTTWTVRGLLIAVFLIALFAEMTHPGVTLPGVIAAAALVALIAPPLLIDLANWWEIAAILAGIILILLEIFVIPGFGVAGVAGILLLFGGMVGTFIPGGRFLRRFGRGTAGPAIRRCDDGDVAGDRGGGHVLPGAQLREPAGLQSIGAEGPGI